MAIKTRPQLVFEPQDYTHSYDATSGTEPDAEGWTLSGTDHASVAASVLTITTASTEACAYYDDIDSVAASDVLAMRLYFKAHAGCATVGAHLEADTLGVKLRLLASGAGTLSVEGVGPAGADVDYSVDVATDYVEVFALLSSTMWRLYVDTGDGRYLLGTGTPEAYSGGNDRCIFGKIATTDDSDPQYWQQAEASICDEYTFAYPPNGWDTVSRSPQRAINLAHDGSVETVHYRDDQDVKFRSVAHSDANAATLTALFSTYMSPGYRFWIAEDYSNHATSFRPVKHIEQRWSFVRSAAAPTHWDMAWSLRVVEV